MMVVYAADVDGGVAADGCSDGLIPCRIEDGRTEIIPAGPVWIGLALAAQGETVEDDVGNFIQDVSFDFDRMQLPDDDGYSRVAIKTLLRLILSPGQPTISAFCLWRKGFSVVRALRSRDL